ncbi:hypothetical protein BC829DRAFT_58864 [Chytridium lagenaria]|nr:hypothetical protein BC829DRAFT_58864 [Chytridium lagenaria]
MIHQNANRHLKRQGPPKAQTVSPKQSKYGHPLKSWITNATLIKRPAVTDLHRLSEETSQELISERTKREDLAKENAQHVQTITQLQEKLTQLTQLHQKDLEDEKEKMKTLRQEMATTVINAERHRTNALAYQNLVERKDGMLREAGEEVERLKKIVNPSAFIFGTVVKGCNGGEENVDEEMVNLRLQLDSERKRGVEMEGQVDRLKRELEAARKEMGEVEGLKGKVEEERKRADELDIELKKVVSLLEAKTLRLELVEAELSAKETAIEERKQQSELIEQIDVLKEELADTVVQKGRLAKSLEEERRGSVEMKSMLEEKVKKVEELEVELKMMNELIFGGGRSRLA